MNKKIMFGFSLAEALITLLIVCLITIASIPVLTKKRRDLSNGTHGKWVCTRHSLGHLVSWRKGLSTSDPNDSDTWTAGCTFVAPKNARNFAITAIGSGGGGASGESEMIYQAETPSNGTFTPSEDGVYRVLVVGGGGGGGGGYRRDSGCKSRRCGHGGSGASGTYILADVELKKGVTYGMAQGNGGAGNCGDMSKCSRDYARATDGGASRFYSYSDNGATLDMYADGGQAGARTALAGKGICKDNCGGNEGGNNKDKGTYIKVNKVDKSSLAILRGNGKNGTNGACSAGSALNGGAGFDGVAFGINVSGIGAGGAGGASYEGGSCGTSGSNGKVAVYKIKRLQGNGGAAAEPKEVLVPTIEGKIDVSVGAVVGPDTDGELSRIEIFDKLGRRTRFVQGLGGHKGEQFTGEAPTKGEDSYWTLDGGGLAASTTCEKVSNTPVYETNNATDVLVCKKIVCTITEDNGFPSGFKIGSPSNLSEIAQTVEVFADSYFSGSNASHTNYLNKMSKHYFQTYFSKAVGGIDYDKIKNAFDSYFLRSNETLSGYFNYSTAQNLQGANYPKLEDNGYCFVDTNNKLYYAKECGEEKYAKYGTDSNKIIGYKTSYKCLDAGDADKKAYGAGGGGGFAHSEPGYASKGGRGAPGAIIIEW